MLVAPDLEGDYYGLEQTAEEQGLGKVRIGSRNVRGRKAKRKGVIKKFFLMVGTLFLLLSFGIYYTALTAAVASQGYKLERLQREIEHIQNENERLEYVVAQMSSLDRIEKEAVEKLGMKKPDLERIVFVSTAKVDQGEAALSSQTSGQEKKQNFQNQDESMPGGERLSKFFNNIFKNQRAEVFLLN
ncbi:MAG: hypothetical protein GX088_01375 [Clostridia bacterium]|nr:hypothetical protein [Clostridia bacterium]